MCSSALLSSRVSLRAGTHRAARFSSGRAGIRAGFGGLGGAEFGFPGALVTTVQSRAMPVCSEPLVHEQRSSDCTPPFTTPRGDTPRGRSGGHFPGPSILPRILWFIFLLLLSCLGECMPVQTHTEGTWGVGDGWGVRAPDHSACNTEFTPLHSASHLPPPTFGLHLYSQPWSLPWLLHACGSLSAVTPGLPHPHHLL